MPLFSSTTTLSTSPKSNGHRQSFSSVSNFLAGFSPTSTTSGRGHHSRPSLPLFASISRNLERALTRALEPVLQPNLVTPSRPPTSRSASMPLLISKAPFMPSRPDHRRRASHMELEQDSSDDQSVYDSFAPSLRVSDFPYYPRGNVYQREESLQGHKRRARIGKNISSERCCRRQGTVSRHSL
jgi:hypothetical protein